MTTNHNKRYMRGYRGEMKSKRWLEERGYYVVLVKGSHGACDLVAIGYSDVRVVQVKSGRTPSKAEVFEIRAAMEKIPRLVCSRDTIAHHLIKELHHWPDRARVPTVEVL